MSKRDSATARARMTTGNARADVVAHVHAATARVDVLAEKLAALLSAGERSIADGTAGSALRPIHEELADLEQWCVTTIEQMNHELALASDWDNKAVLSIREGRPDLAQTALARAASHREAGELLRSELKAFSSVLAQMRLAQSSPGSEL